MTSWLRMLAILLTVVTIPFVSACSESQLGDGMRKGNVESQLTLDEARQEAREFEAEIQELYPRATWRVSDDGALPEECETAEGAEGAYFRRAVYRTDNFIVSKRDARTAVEYLASLDFGDFEERSFAKGNHQFTAAGPTGIGVYFVAETDSLGVTVDSACVAGSYTEARAKYGRILLENSKNSEPPE